MLDGAAHFTPAERRALPLIALPISIAAHRLGVSDSAAKQTFRAITTKLGAANRIGAVARLAGAGIQLEILPAPRAGGH